VTCLSCKRKKKSQKRAGEVAQGVGPEFKPSTTTTTTTKSSYGQGAWYFLESIFKNKGNLSQKTPFVDFTHTLTSFFSF
jgi:hypothetical protein